MSPLCSVVQSGHKRRLEINVEIKTIPALINDVMHYFLRFLDFQSLLNFETVIKNSSSLKDINTDIAWGELKINENLNYSWALCESKNGVPKWEYSLGRVLYQYIFVHKYQDEMMRSIYANKQLLIQKIQTKFQGIIAHFPILNAFIGIDRYRWNKFGNLTDMVSQSEIEQFESACSKGYSGEKFLKGLIEFCACPLNEQSAATLFIESINDHSTCASTYALENEFSDEINEQLAVKAAIHKDETVLEKLLELDDQLAIKLYEQGHRFYSVCVYLGYGCLLSDDFVKANIFYSHALKSDHILSGNDAMNAAYVKYRLELYVEADELNAIALNLLGENAPCDFLASAGSVKMALKQFKAADEFFTRALEIVNWGAEGEQIYLLEFAGDAKKELNQYREADDLYMRELKRVGQAASPDLLIHAADMKWELGDSVSADVLYIRALNAFELLEQTVPSYLLGCVGEIAMAVRQYEVADVLFTRALEAIQLQGENATYSLLKSACEAKIQLKQYQKAKDLYKRMLELDNQDDQNQDEFTEAFG